MFAVLLRTVLLLVAVGTTAVCAQSLGVATWNLQWLMDAATHARWVTTCERNGWPVHTETLPAAERRALA